MKKSVCLYICIFIIVLCILCLVSKFIFEDKYLLDEVRIVFEMKEVKLLLFNLYICQNFNVKWFNLVKIFMCIYCVLGVDFIKWINCFFRKIGDVLVIYDEFVVLKFQEEIEKVVCNMGYMGVIVYLDKKMRKNKLKLVYCIYVGYFYKVCYVVYDIDDLVISDYMWQVFV